MTERELAELLRNNPDLRVEGDVAPRPPVPMTQQMRAALPTVQPTNTLRLTLGFPPSANRYWRHHRGRVHRSSEATAYKDSVGRLCESLGIAPTERRVKVRLDIYRPARRGDLDNRIKIVLDSLSGHAYVDDKQVVEIHARLRDDKHNPRVEVEISEPS